MKGPSSLENSPKGHDCRSQVEQSPNLKDLTMKIQGSRIKTAFEKWKAEECGEKKESNLPGDKWDE